MNRTPSTAPAGTGNRSASAAATPAGQPRPGDREHRPREVDPDDRPAQLGQAGRHGPGADADLEQRVAGGQQPVQQPGQPPPAV